MLLTTKAVAAEIKLDAAKRQVTGYASTFGNIDLGNDRVMPGAYRKTLTQDLPAGRIKVKRAHETLIGKPIHAEEDSTGLLTVSQISKTAVGDETLTLIEDGVLAAMSIGYYPEAKRYVTEGERKIRNLEIVRLKEWSFVEEPMNEAAVIVGVKSLEDVAQTLDQMASALYHLRSLSYVPPEIAARLADLIREMQSLPAASPAADTAPLLALIGEFQSFLTQRS